MCRSKELLMSPEGHVYRCHRDLYAQENPTGNILDSEFEIKDIQITVYRVDRKTKNEIASGEIDDGVIKANTTTIQKGKVRI